MEISEEERIRIQEKVEKLKQSKFKQQMLPAWRPVPSYGSTTSIFVVFGIIFLTLGITLYVMSDKIQFAELQYNDICSDHSVCNQTLTLSSTITAPIYVYYELGNFY